MSHDLVGLLLAALPGLVMVLRNMSYVRPLQKQIAAVAWNEHAWNDTQLGHGQQFTLLKNPERYICASDSPGIIKVKRELLVALPKVYRRHWNCGAILFIGAAVGGLVGSLVG